MSDSLQEITAQTPAQDPDSESWEVHSEADRYDGSRTPAERQLMIWQLGREGRTAGDIARFLGMKPYTVKAVLEREQSIIAESRMLLRANTLNFARDLIAASPEAAKRGKIEGIKATLESLGAMDRPMPAQTSVGVQVVLNGGPDPFGKAQPVVVEAVSVDAPTDMGAK